MHVDGQSGAVLGRGVRPSHVSTRVRGRVEGLGQAGLGEVPSGDREGIDERAVENEGLSAPRPVGDAADRPPHLDGGAHAGEPGTGAPGDAERVEAFETAVVFRAGWQGDGRPQGERERADRGTWSHGTKMPRRG